MGWKNCRTDSRDIQGKIIWSFMRKEYDFSKSHKNPYRKYLKKQVTLCLGIDVIDYFRKLAEETGIPYQNLINLFLQDCAKSHKKTYAGFIILIFTGNTLRFRDGKTTERVVDIFSKEIIDPFSFSAFLLLILILV